MKKLILISCLLATAITTNAQQTDFPKLTGPYLDQKPPGMTPEIFAPGIVSTELHEFACSFTPDGKEFYFSRRDFEKNEVGVFFTKLTKDGWSIPTEFIEMACYEPLVTPNGKRLYFSEMGVKDNKLQMVIWYLERNEQEWSKPISAGEFLSPDKAMYISVANSGNIYTTNITGGMGNAKLAVSQFVDNKNSELRNIGPFFNDGKNEMYPFISPDESYLLFCHPVSQLDDGNGIYVTFNVGNGKWSEPKYVDLGMKAGTPYVSPDGKYLFFTSGERRKGDIYWVSSKIIEELRPRE
jgi:Tol biopolymer transport system component